MAEIAPALYRNTSIQALDLSSNGLDDLASANVLQELLRRWSRGADVGFGRK
jgi:hypothetical protein